MMDPCRPPERLWCCASADTQDLVGIYGVSTGTFFSFLCITSPLSPPPHSPSLSNHMCHKYIYRTQRRFEKSAHLFPWDFFFLFSFHKRNVRLTLAPRPAPPHYAEIHKSI